MRPARSREPPRPGLAAATGRPNRAGPLPGRAETIRPRRQRTDVVPYARLHPALDFPGGPDTLALLAELDDIAHAHGGRVYLAKDAAAAPERVRQGYPRLPDFQATRARWNGTPERFTSALARRLQL